MHNCLVNICKEFEELKGFLKNQTSEKELVVDRLFSKFIECFSDLKEEKLEYPNEFRVDVRLYKDGDKALVNKFKDVQIRYLMLSDFYDFARLTKKYKSK